MLRKERKIIVTFETTTDAMDFEDFCKAHRVPGRIIPLPTEISAGCGLSWCAAPSDRDAVDAAVRESGITPGGVCECMV